jgi:hypothetical protein
MMHAPSTVVRSIDVGERSSWNTWPNSEKTVDSSQLNFSHQKATERAMGSAVNDAVIAKRDVDIRDALGKDV